MASIGSRLKKTAVDVAGALNDAAQTARERLNEMAELNRLNLQRRKLMKERDACKIAMADLLIRMFDQNTFADALLRPEYLRIKEIDEELVTLEQERAHVLAAHAHAAAEPEAIAETEATSDEAPPAE